jgi:hypothetical protein
VGNLELKLGLLGLEVRIGTAGSGLDVANLLGDLVGLVNVFVGSGGRGRIDFMLSDRTSPSCLGGEEGGTYPSDDEVWSMVAFKDLTLFDRGRSETLEGDARVGLPVFDRASDALVGVSNEGARPNLGRGSVDGLEAISSSSM